MNTKPVGLYRLFEVGLGDLSWQQWVDLYQKKYDKQEIDGFAKQPTKLTYTWQQLISQVAAKALPAYVDPESPGYEAALSSLTGRTGNIPTMKRFYRINRVMLHEQMLLLQKLGGYALTPEMRDTFLRLIDEGTDGLIQSYYNGLTHQRHQVVSTGKFTIDNVNNPRGIQGVTLEFGVATPDVLTGTARWWTNASHVQSNEGSASDPIGYMTNRVKAIRRTHHYYGPLTLELTQDLLDDLFTHSKVLSKIGLAYNPASASDSSGATAIAVASALSDEAKKEVLRKLIRVDAIVPRDSYAFVDAPGTNSDGLPDLVTTQIENFKGTNISFIPSGNIGDIQGVQPLSMGYDEDKVAYFDGGRFLMTQRANPETHSLYVEGEAAQLCVPNKPQYMFISTVTV